MEVTFKQIRGHTFRDCFPEAPLLIDLGANVGKFASEFLGAYPSAEVVLVEGDPFLTDILKKKFADRRNVKLFQGLVGPESRPDASFHLSKIPEGNSVIRALSETWGSGESREIQVEMITLDALSALVHPERVHLLKIDIEGSEWDVLEGFSEAQATLIEQLSVEFHDFLDPGQRPRTERCISRLQKLGYTFRCRATEHVHGSPYFDCLFYRAGV